MLWFFVGPQTLNPETVKTLHPKTLNPKPWTSTYIFRPSQLGSPPQMHPPAALPAPDAGMKNIDRGIMWGFPKVWGYPFGGPKNKDNCTSGSILGSHHLKCQGGLSAQ